MCDSSLLHVPALSLQPHSQGLFFFLNAFMPVHDSRTLKDYAHSQEGSPAAEKSVICLFLGIFVFLKI